MVQSLTARAAGISRRFPTYGVSGNLRAIRYVSPVASGWFGKAIE